MTRSTVRLLFAALAAILVPSGARAEMATYGYHWSSAGAVLVGTNPDNVTTPLSQPAAAKAGACSPTASGPSGREPGGSAGAGADAGGAGPKANASKTPAPREEATAAKVTQAGIRRQKAHEHAITPPTSVVPGFN